MNMPSPKTVLASAVALGASLPAWAHVTVPASPHLHASDLDGVAVVVALTVAAGWIDRRLQRAKQRRQHDAAEEARRGAAPAERADARDPVR